MYIGIERGTRTGTGTETGMIDKMGVCIAYCDCECDCDCTIYYSNSEMRDSEWTLLHYWADMQMPSVISFKC